MTESEPATGAWEWPDRPFCSRRPRLGPSVRGLGLVARRAYIPIQIPTRMDTIPRATSMAHMRSAKASQRS